MANPMRADLTLLDLPLKRSGAIIASALGEFTAPSRQELALLRPGGVLELYRIEKTVVESNDDDEEDDEEYQKGHDGAQATPQSSQTDWQGLFSWSI